MSTKKSFLQFVIYNLFFLHYLSFCGFYFIRDIIGGKKMSIKTYKKGQVTKLSTNFNSTEFDCHGSGCCNETYIDE